MGGARRGVPRRRLVTAAPGGPGPRPPGTTTRPRAARCTDPEEMPEMEARAPAQNRHGGAPRGARLPLETQGASQAPGVPRHEHAGVPRHGAPRLSALRHPSGWRKESCKPRAQSASRERGRMRVTNGEEKRRFVKTNPMTLSGKLVKTNPTP